MNAKIDEKNEKQNANSKRGFVYSTFRKKNHLASYILIFTFDADRRGVCVCANRTLEEKEHGDDGLQFLVSVCT